MRDDDVPGPGEEATLAYPDQVETVDALGARARVALDRARALADATPPPAALERRGERVAIGRYQLLEMVGAGGMGVVWGAWDPELERRVALKLVRMSASAARERILREGQALARLSHPNVVPIFDVGVLGDQVYLVMEWVRGTTLRVYAAQAPGARALLDAYLQAGAGLVAAHRAGVIHRDFKPDNVIRGDDGRVRVLDFGLARPTSTLAQGSQDVPAPQGRGAVDAAAAAAPLDAGDALAGTPGYMAPEQLRGEPATASVDQYAFCVSLREALERAGGVPGWVAAIVARGAAEDESRRFASMQELLAALHRDPARRWRRAGLAAAVLGLASGGFAFGRTRVGAALAPCTGVAGEIAMAWRPELRTQVAAHLHGLGPLPGADTQRIVDALDGDAARWVTARRDACLAIERKELTPPRDEGRLACLLRTRAQLAAVGELLAKVDAGGLSSALQAARSLPDAQACAAQDDAAVAPPAVATAAQVRLVAPAIERALVLTVARRPEALATAQAAVAAARPTGYPPLIARALLIAGRAAINVNDGKASALLEEATTTALGAFDDATAVEAYARRVFDRARQGETAIDGWPVMSTLAQRLGARGQFARALLYNNRGVARLAAGDSAAARELFGRALAEAGDQVERGDIELLAIPRNLAKLERDPDRARALLVRTMTRMRSVLGAEHPETQRARVQVAMLTRHRHAARVELEAACAGLERWGQSGPARDCAYEAGWLADEDGDMSAAIDWMVRASEPDAGTEPTVRSRVAAAYVGLQRGSVVVSEILAIATEQEGRREMWDRIRAADAYVIAYRIAGSLSPHLDRALAVLESVDFPIAARRVARVQSEVAQRTAVTRPAEAKRLAASALSWYRGVDEDAAVVSRLEHVARTSAPVAQPEP